MGIGVLGPLMVGGDTAALGPRDRVVLAALVAHHGEAVSAESLADALWGEDPPVSSNKVVQGCVMRLRKTLGASAIETHGNGYALVVPTDEVDASRFESRVLRAQELLGLGEPDRALHQLEDALGLWRGRPLAELEDWAPGHVEAERLEELRRDAEELRVHAALGAGRWREVLAEAKALVARAPLREQRWALLALAQYQAGRQADALATIREARRHLVEELGLEPGPDLVDLEDAILQHDPTLVAPAALPDASSECPYLGLVSYDVGDADAFFGRDRDVSECLDRLAGDGALVVVGPSGSGKSSLVRAGVGAALQRDGKRVMVVTPGPRPTNSIAVDRSDPLPVLIVDQCEEAVTLCRDPSEQSRFFDALADHSTKGNLIVALRADRLGEMSAHPRFAALIERGLFLLRAMNGEDLRAAIEGPARQAGLVLEPGLVDLLIRDVEGEPGALPLLSHALRQTWERREGRTLTVGGYRASGGIRGAVAQSAEQVYEHAPPEKRPILRDLLLRLVTPSPEGDPVRSRVPRRIVASDPAHEQVIEELVAARLVTSDEDNVELAHEALARAWPRLREWLADDIEGQRIWRHLASAADAWETMGRPGSELYRGVRLARAIEWRQTAGPDLNPTEQAFLDASQQAAERERLAAEEEAKRQARANRKLRLMIVGVAAFAAVATVGGVIAVRQSQRADLEADVARSHELAASAVSVLDDDPSLAKLLAVAAARTAPVPTIESLAALHRTAAADLSTTRYHATYDVGLLWTDIHPSGDRMVAAGTHPVDGSGGVLEVVDPYTNRLMWSFDVGYLGLGSAYVGSPFFTADGAHLVVGVFWDPYNRMRGVKGFEQPPKDQMGAFVVDADTGDVIERFDLGRCGGWVTAMSETHLLARTLQGTPEVLAECRWQEGDWAVELVDRQSGDRQVLSSGAGSWWGAAMSGDGRLVAYDDGGEIVVVDVDTGTELLRRTGAGVRAMNADGSLLLVGDQPMEVWDLATGEIAATFDGHGSPSLFAQFDHHGNTIYSTGADGTLRVWDAMTGQEQFVYPGVGNGRPSIADDGFILVGRPDRDTAVLLDTRIRGELGAVDTCAGSAAPDSLRIIDGLALFQIDCAGGSSGTTYLVDLEALEVLYALPGHQAGGLAVSPDGTRFVRQEGESSRHGPLVVRNLHTGEQVVDLKGLCRWDADSELLAGQQDDCRPYPDQPFPIRADRITWSPDGTMIAASVDTGLAVWDTRTGNLIFTETPNPGRIRTRDIIFTPDSDELVATAGDMRMRSFNAQTWSPIAERAEFVDGGHQLGLIGYPDGTTILLAAGAFQAATASALHWFDSETWDWKFLRTNIHEGSLQAATLNTDGTRIATAATDGFVRIWDAATADVIQEIPFGDVPVYGVGFVDDNRLAVTLDGGGLVLVTIDPDELLDVVAASLTRGFSLTECERFNFGDDCPTLAELRGPGPGARELSGVFRLKWSRDELASEFVNTAVRDGVDPDDETLLEGSSELASVYAGAYVMTLADGRFDIEVDTFDDAYCTGTYTVEDDRIWLHSERGSICVEIKLFDAGFELTDDELLFDFDDFRGPWPDKHVFATRAWTKIG